jgi:hypothetical protein
MPSTYARPRPLRSRARTRARHIGAGLPSPTEWRDVRSGRTPCQGEIRCRWVTGKCSLLFLGSSFMLPPEGPSLAFHRVSSIVGGILAQVVEQRTYMAHLREQTSRRGPTEDGGASPSGRRARFYERAKRFSLWLHPLPHPKPRASQGEARHNSEGGFCHAFGVSSERNPSMRMRQRGSGD